MLYKKKKPFFLIVFKSLFYVILTIFCILGLLQFGNQVYNYYYEKEQKIQLNTIDLALKPIEKEEIVSNNIIIEESEEIEEPIAKDPKIEAAMDTISNYYKKNIDKNFKVHFSANENNICKFGFNVSKNELNFISCDDYAFKRQVELALTDVKPFKDKVINGIDLSKEVVYFDYLINKNILNKK